jgi:DNA-binding transcriptional MerR regulator
LSIGEVLSLLREEFPDITISKIRFLESQGLLDPERTPSGYRKFYDDDVERLRWILRQQREHFLPLKVIKGRLSEPGSEPDADEPPVAGSGAAGEVTVGAVTGGMDERAGTWSAPDGPDGVSPGGPPGVDDEAGAPAGQERLSLSETAAPVAGAAVEPAPSRSRPPVTGAAGQPAGQPLGQAAGAVNMTLEELAAVTGLDHEQVRDLARYGLLVGRDLGGTVYFDDEALTVAQLAAGFARHGVEARHLRMYKNAADRETGVFEQVVMPLFKQRNPRARQQAMGTLEELSRLGTELRDALLRAALRDAF